MTDQPHLTKSHFASGYDTARRRVADLEAQIAQLEQANSTLSGQNTDLGDRLLEAQRRAQAADLSVGALTELNGLLIEQNVRLEAVVQAARQIREAARAMAQCGQTGTNAWKLALELNSEATSALYTALEALDDSR